MGSRGGGPIRAGGPNPTRPPTPFAHRALAPPARPCQIARVTSPPPQLAPRYYLEHFEEMLGFVREHYAPVLEGRHERFLDEFGALSRDERCLYVRLANRTGEVFRLDWLRYEEIADLAGTAARLRRERFLRRPGEGDVRSILVLHRREELVEWIREAEAVPDLPRLSSARKRVLVEHLADHLSLDTLGRRVRLADYVVQDRIEELGYLFFLYFGRLESSLIRFALRDLGLVRGSGFRTSFEPRFSDRDAAATAYCYARALGTLEGKAPRDLDGLLAESATWPDAVDLETRSLRARALHRLGRLLERAGRAEDALAVHRRNGEFPSTERSARLLLAAGREVEARAFLEGLVASPSCDEELIFAEDLLARKFGDRRVGRLTAMLRTAETIAVDEALRDEPEAGAARHLRRRGAEAHHVENALWRQLFGLAFWDLLYGEEHAAVHNEFERLPAGLDSGAFHRRHEGAIARRLALFDDPAAALDRLDATWEAQAGTSNAIVPWYPELFAVTRELVRLAPPGAPGEVLDAMARNFRANRSGFPDLLVFEDGRPGFVEVKAEGDHVQRHQLAQLERLENAGFPVSVLRVRWACDPGQEYVVVDVETTGGNPAWNRVTEIGAVRVRGDRAVEEWSTLVNPHRRIPRKIVALTGITDEMVAGAPAFEEIADEFLDFVGDAVFVGHRVKFDYGFLRAECERAGRELRRPTVCTVVETRRHFPGLPSYGLAKLCEHFGIPLENHHRALEDARATAGILARINRKRAESPSR